MTKTPGSQVAQTVSAGGSVNGTSIDLTSAFALSSNITITNGATGPTAPCQVQWQGSHDGSTWWDITYPVVAGTANNGVYTWYFEWGESAPSYVRPVYSGNTGQAVTFDHYWTVVT